jgi:hypothetical protein
LQAFVYTKINYLHASISTSLHIEINCLPWIWGLLVSRLRWKIWGMAPDIVEVGSAGEESGGTGEEVAKASEDVGDGAGKEIGGGGGGDSDKEVKGGDDAGLDVVLPLCWLPLRPFPPLPEPCRPVLSTGARSASMGAPRRGDDWH